MINKIEPLPKQKQFMSLKSTHSLLVSGYGFGKTETKLMAILADMGTFYKDKPTLAVYDPTYDLLRLNTLPRLIERLEQLKIKYVHNKHANTIDTKFAKIILRSMDTPARIVAYESFRSYIDELETLRPDQIIDVWNKINGRNRQKLPNYPEARNKTYTFTTPDAGFGFTYKMWGLAKDKEQFDYVRASTRDNPHLPSDYVKNLEAIYPSGMIQAFLDGQWCNITSGSVYPEFNRDINVFSAKGNEEFIRAHEGREYLLGIDFNIGACSVVVGFLHKGVLYIVDEFLSENTYTIIEHYSQKPYANNRATAYPDASGLQRSTNSTITDVNILKKHFGVRVKAYNPRVNERVLSVNMAFKNKKVLIADNCINLIEAFEKHAYDPNTQEPQKFKVHPSIDDRVDSAGYMIFNLFPVVKPSRVIEADFG